MATSTPFTVVVGVDYSDAGTLALQRALAVAGERENVDLHVIAVLEGSRSGFEYPQKVDEEVLIEEGSRTLSAYVADQLARMPKDKKIAPRRVHTHLDAGRAAEQIVELSISLDADMIVVGSHGRRGVPRMLLGSVAEGVVRLAHCPVLVVRDKDYDRLSKVPKVEPPCKECVKVRQASNGEKLWCAQHSERHGRRHTYHQGDRVSGMTTSSSLIHT